MSAEDPWHEPAHSQTHLVPNQDPPSHNASRSPSMGRIGRHASSPGPSRRSSHSLSPAPSSPRHASWRLPSRRGHTTTSRSSSVSAGERSPGIPHTPTGVHSAPPSATVSHHLVPSLPTVGLLESVVSAAHYSGTSGDVHAHGYEKFRPTFAEGQDRTKLDPVRQRILDDTIALFCGKASPEIFERHWRKDAVFEDPLCRCKGYREYTAQWYGLAKMVSKSTTVTHRVLASTSSPSRIVYSQTQEYKFRLLPRKKVVQSLVVIHLDGEDKIEKLEDKWRGDEQPTKWGASFWRGLNAKALPLLVRVPKSPRRPALPSSGVPGDFGPATYPPQSASES